MHDSENLTGEVPLADLLGDPLCRMLMVGDRLEPTAVAEAMRAVAIRLAGPRPAHKRVAPSGARPARNRMSNELTTRPSASPATAA